LFCWKEKQKNKSEPDIKLVQFLYFLFFKKRAKKIRKKMYCQAFLLGLLIIMPSMLWSTLGSLFFSWSYANSIEQPSYLLLDTGEGEHVVVDAPAPAIATTQDSQEEELQEEPQPDDDSVLAWHIKLRRVLESRKLTRKDIRSPADEKCKDFQDFDACVADMDCTWIRTIHPDLWMMHIPGDCLGYDLYRMELGTYAGRDDHYLWNFASMQHLGIPYSKSPYRYDRGEFVYSDIRKLRERMITKYLEARAIIHQAFIKGDEHAYLPIIELGDLVQDLHPLPESCQDIDNICECVTSLKPSSCIWHQSKDPLVGACLPSDSEEQRPTNFVAVMTFSQKSKECLRELDIIKYRKEAFYYDRIIGIGKRHHVRALEDRIKEMMRSGRRFGIAFAEADASKQHRVKVMSHLYENWDFESWNPTDYDLNFEIGIAIMEARDESPSYILHLVNSYADEGLWQLWDSWVSPHNKKVFGFTTWFFFCWYSLIFMTLGIFFLCVTWARGDSDSSIRQPDHPKSNTGERKSENVRRRNGN